MSIKSSRKIHTVVQSFNNYTFSTTIMSINHFKSTKTEKSAQECLKF